MKFTADWFDTDKIISNIEKAATYFEEEGQIHEAITCDEAVMALRKIQDLIDGALNCMDEACML